jgi:hypothetical protein
MGRVSTNGGVPCASIAISKTSPAFSVSRKRRKSFPSETHVKRGPRVVHGDVELTEKLGATIYVHAAPDAGFKACCMESGAHDGSNRDYYF